MAPSHELRPKGSLKIQVSTAKELATVYCYRSVPALGDKFKVMETDREEYTTEIEDTR